MHDPRSRFPHFAAIVLAALIGLSACGNADQAGDEIAATAGEQVQPETSQAADESQATEKPAVAVTEDIAGVVETEGTDIKSSANEIVLDSSAAPAGAVTWKYAEGDDFRRMTTAQGTSSAPDKIEVAEVFWYGCPHCYDFDPILESWKKTLPPDVAFVRIPVIWNPTNQVHARLMYTAEALGVSTEAHDAIFKSIHQSGNMLTDEDDMVALFSKFGVSEADFREAYDSFGVSSAVKRAENLTRRYGIRSVPVIVVNGKYATDAPNVRSFSDMIEVTDELIERERSL
jgi:thiol:disulfide interchange protein DsbA